jgi:hypothetical protein
LQHVGTQLQPPHTCWKSTAGKHRVNKRLQGQRCADRVPVSPVPSILCTRVIAHAPVSAHAVATCSLNSPTMVKPYVHVTFRVYSSSHLTGPSCAAQDSSPSSPSPAPPAAGSPAPPAYANCPMRQAAPRAAARQ